ncbi:MAG: hypothetical protein LBC02_03330, partial [Planctomycetaceae bacterium]|nr:hypothetical protein [Planctomycetaceae bacterium]
DLAVVPCYTAGYTLHGKKFPDCFNFWGIYSLCQKSRGRRSFRRKVAPVEIYSTPASLHLLLRVDSITEY